jgi:hypothetical protein
MNLHCYISVDAAAEALTDMPPRSEEELDPVTLHNQAMIHVDMNLADSFAKLQYLLSQNPFPPETFANLLLLYCKYEVSLRSLKLNIFLVYVTLLSENSVLFENRRPSA